jgi:hypothetical protein
MDRQTDIQLDQELDMMRLWTDSQTDKVEHRMQNCLRWLKIKQMHSSIFGYFLRQFSGFAIEKIIQLQKVQVKVQPNYKY